ncbi:MAG: hypothetical protein EXQ85_00525 [Alphaproteobacteria bacterium]|nr:hypothetical protein [Alphaproteobacteria bacterium]
MISDVFDQAQRVAGAGRAVALRAVALDPGDTTPEALYRMHRAGDAASFREALRLYGAPMQNVLYADREGNIGFVAAGRVPVRRAGRGLSPTDGASGAGDWIGFLPFDANNRIVDRDYPHFISADWEPAYRAERLRALLGGGAALDVDTPVRWQNDTYSTVVDALLPMLLPLVRASKLPGPASDAYTALGRWNRHMDRERPEPLIFSAWLMALNERLVADNLGDLFASFAGERPDSVRRVLT